MNRTVDETALLLAVILNRSAQSRARVSTKTLKLLARRTHLRSVFIVQLTTTLADRYDWILTELATGGYGAVQAKALEAAKPVTAKRYLTDDERKDLRQGTADLAALEDEVITDQEEPEQDE